jgi:hypothetical protein
MDVDKKNDLGLGEKIINHLSNALPVKYSMVDVFFVLRIDIRLEISNKLAKH